jgi:hypothetical protein
MSSRFIKAIPCEDIEIKHLFYAVGAGNINIHSIMIDNCGAYTNWTCARNLTFGQKIAMWNLLGLNFMIFDYLKICDRRMSQEKYNVSKIVDFQWGQIIVVMNSLQRRRKIKYDISKGIRYVPIYNGCSWSNWMNTKDYEKFSVKESDYRYKSTIFVAILIEPGIAKDCS